MALARSLFKRGADFTAAMVPEFASTSLVFDEFGIVMALLLGWQFVAEEFLGGTMFASPRIGVGGLRRSRRPRRDRRPGPRLRRGGAVRADGHADRPLRGLVDPQGASFTVVRMQPRG